MSDPDCLLISVDLPKRRQRIALWLLALFGWRVKYAPLPGSRGVVIFYPHTSNWDFIIGILTKFAIGIPVQWLGKESLFKGVSGLLFGRLLRAWGGEPIERGTPTGAIERLAARMQTADNYWLALAPEGTRQYRDHWRSGFYHIALTANVPLGMAFIDYPSKQIGLVDYLNLSGDPVVDMAAIHNVYRGRKGLRPELAAPIVLRASELPSIEN